MSVITLTDYIATHDVHLTESTECSFKNIYFSKWLRHIMTSSNPKLISRKTWIEIFRSGNKAQRNECQIMEEIVEIAVSNNIDITHEFFNHEFFVESRSNEHEMSKLLTRISFDTKILGFIHSDMSGLVFTPEVCGEYLVCTSSYHDALKTIIEKFVNRY